jgi:hypothetical protein
MMPEDPRLESERASLANLLLFFDGQVRLGQERSHIDQYPITRTLPVRARNNPAFREALAAMGETVVGTTRQDAPDRKAVERYLHLALTSLAQSLALRAYHAPFEQRVMALEARVSRLELHQVKGASGERFAKDRSVLEEVKMHLTAIKSSFITAFPGAQVEITILSGSTGEHDVTAVLNVDHSNRAILDQARGSGARKQFYELLVERLPPQVFDAIDFEIHFPEP